MGLCGPGRIPLEERFWYHVRRGPGCWEWTASVGTSGYGQIGRGGSGRGMLKANRVSWEMHFGPIPEGTLVCHKCDNRCCVRPSHLFLGSPLDNTRDMYRKGRSGPQTKPERMPRGERHGRAVLTEKAVLEMRELAKGDWSYPRLAKKFGVSPGTVGHVVSRRTWKSVEAPC